MNRQRTWLPTLLVWAMLPLTVLSGSPRSACLCSNGDLKPFCRKAQARRACCGESWNLGDASFPQQHTCCRESGRSGTEPATCTVAGCHCTAVVVLPDVSSKVETTEAPEFDVAPNGGCRIVLNADHPSHRQALGWNRSPPDEGRDLVILLSRMLA